jgi:hypothetical protein
VNRFRYPVVRVYPTHSEMVSEHLTKDDAEQAAAYLDFIAEDTGIWHVAEDPCCQPDHRRAN